MGESSGTFLIKQLQLINVLMLFITTERMEGITNSAKLKIIISEIEAILQKHDAKPVGPLLMRTSIQYNGTTQNNFTIAYIQQADVFITDIEAPYAMEKYLCTADCVYIRFYGQHEAFLYLLNKTIDMIGYDNLMPEKEIYFVFSMQDDNSDDIAVEIYIPVLI